MAELHGMRLRGIDVELLLGPPVTVDNSSKLLFQTKLEQEHVMQPTSIEKGESSIALAEHPKSERSSFIVHMEADQLSVHDNFPPRDTSECIGRIDGVIRAAIEVFSPTFFARTSIYVRKQALAPGDDARVFLAEKVLGLSDKRRRVFGRPIHMVGMTFFLPPYQVPGDEGGSVAEQATDGIEVKMESLMEDCRDIYFQCRRYFHKPIAAGGFSTLGEQVQSTEKFVDEQLVAFLYGDEN